jgi:hypothetical protein
LLIGKLEVKEVINRALRSVMGLEPQAEDWVEHQVEQLMEAIQQLQKRIEYLELRIMPNTPQDVKDQREATAWSTIERIKYFSMECKPISNHSAQNYEKLTENA